MERGWRVIDLPGAAGGFSRVASRRLALLGLALLAGCASPDGPNVVEVQSAWRIVQSSAAESGEPPPGMAAFAAGAEIPLPDVWPLHARGNARSAWYRASFDLPEGARGRWVVYLPRLAMNAAVWLNGERIGDGGPFTPYLANASNRPLLVDVPAGLLHPGANRVDILLAFSASFPAALGAFFVGPAVALEPAYEWRTFWQVTLIQLSIALNLYLAVVAFLLHRRQSALRGLMGSALGSLLWAIGLLGFTVREPPFAPLVWQWLTTGALGVSVAAFVIGAHRFLELGARSVDRAVILVTIAGSAGFAAALASGRPAMVEYSLLAWVAAIGVVGAYLLRLLRRAQERGPERSFRLGPSLIVLGFVVAGHDVALAAGFAVEPSFALLPYLGTLLAVRGVARTIELLTTALSSSEDLNRDLERRVAERGDEIARSYERVRELERRDLLQAERERLMRDIHDGLGAQLTSTLAAVESEEATRGEIADDLRDTLDDMRLLVASLAPGNDDLVALLAHWRGRIQRRLERRGLYVDWRVEDLPPLPWLGPREAMSALRIFQEAVSNALQHAAASTIVVSTGVRPGEHARPGVFVEIRDDGVGPGIAASRDGMDGHAAAPPAGGFGLTSMMRRAADLGGSVTISDAAPGTRVVLWLPLVRADAPDTGRPA